MSGGRLRWGWRLFPASKWFRQHLAVASFPAFVYTACASTSDRQPNYDDSGSNRASEASRPKGGAPATRSVGRLGRLPQTPARRRMGMVHG
jgi:hypothetical protein